MDNPIVRDKSTSWISLVAYLSPIALFVATYIQRSPYSKNAIIEAAIVAGLTTIASITVLWRNRKHAPVGFVFWSATCLALVVLPTTMHDHAYKPKSAAQLKVDREEQNHANQLTSALMGAS